MQATNKTIKEDISDNWPFLKEVGSKIQIQWVLYLDESDFQTQELKFFIFTWAIVKAARRTLTSHISQRIIIISSLSNRNLKC